MADLADGDSIEVQGSAKSPYVIKNVGGVYSCTCPAWRNQSLAIEQRTCKHIRQLRGDDAEQQRIGNPVAASPPRGKAAGSAKSDKQVPPLLLAHRWENDVELRDWWMSEKLDGVRAYWDGEKFLSRQGNVFHAPDWFIQPLPKMPLDGELWIDRGAFQRTVSVVRRQDKSDHWKEVRYVVFDAPGVEEVFEGRMEVLNDQVRGASCTHLELLEQQRCRGDSHLLEELRRVEALRGEGLMLRMPGSRYEAGRSTTLLKVKTFYDAEARVLEHKAGRGRHKGRLGALVVENADGTTFSIGTGFSDKQREAPPEIGSFVTFRYQELTDAGVPRFPAFVGLRTDVDQGEGGEGRGAGNRGATRKSARSKSPAAPVSARKSAKAAPPTSKSPAPAKAAAKAAAKPKATLKSAAPSEQPTIAQDAPLRYFEFRDAKSQKFWEIGVSDAEVTVRYGKIGTDGQTRTKTLANAVAAQGHADKLIDEKLGKGYEEIS